MPESKRVEDFNGWYEVADNPISKEGIYEYLGSKIGAPDPDKVYKVYRPAEELSKPETIESFRLLPWINEHLMLGNESERQNVVDAERKGVQGVLGEKIHFKDGTLFGNIKVFTERLAKLIENGKKQLSAGYRAKYDFNVGTWNGLRYDAIQHTIRGNHLALVDEGRMGETVAVLDHKDTDFYEDEFFITLDSKEFTMPESMKDTKDQDEEMTLESLAKLVMQLAEDVKAMKAEKKEDHDEDMEMEDMKDKDDEDTKDTKDGDYEDGEDTKDSDDDGEETKDTKDSDDEDKDTMDELDTRIGKLENKKTISMVDIRKEMAACDKLARDLAPHVGTFDHSDKTLNQIAKYGCKKLGLNPAAGGELTAIDAYLVAASKHNTQKFGHVDTVDSKEQGDSFVDKYLNHDAKAEA